MANPVPQSTLDAILGVVGRKDWIDDEAGMEPHLVKRRGLWRGTCAAVVRPASSAETGRVVEICAESGVPITPQGGNTGGVGGGVPDGGIVLSTARMSRIRAVDPLNHTITVEAGCLFLLSLAAEGSCQIVGNLSTNAGGIQVLRYGNARGRVWDGLRGLRKDNTGYDLKHLFIGAEGTLGIITAAVLKLYPAIHAREAALVAIADAQAVLDVFIQVRDACGNGLTAFEMISHMPFDFALKHIARMRDPFEAPHPFYALIELTSPRPGGALRETLQAVLARALEDGVAKDAVIATSEAQAKELWTIREDINEAQTPEGGSIKHDVSVPVSPVPEFLRRATEILERAVLGGRVVAFGHVRDGNIHFNLSQPEGADTDAFMAETDRVVRGVHYLVAEMEGSFSAEHGIGLHKRDLLEHYKSDVEMDLMRTVKRTLDAKSIMNPGKVL